ncbi:MAG: hypothetical protein EB141_18940 [Verrucomicrobia bacterium]|nr:hypothetical protein [Verrucomicrobiota bacterium]NBU09265.1 hypothetical protein [Pseudomonadota bacterium]NDA68960.1 hypothetical protein [Verrucomicrobiota bacterium]NDB77689.1 hypothetical protein [Verrucomicrobiota bacterium]NDD40508.1 hypothetical protein [Verrucomicrobiota bacterium]
MSDEDKPSVIGRILGWGGGISLTTFVCLRLISLAVKQQAARQEEARLAKESAPPVVSPAQQAEQEARQADLRPLADLMNQLEQSHKANADAFNAAPKAPAQLAVVRDRIVPGLRTQKSQLEQITPKTAPGKQAHQHMTEMVQAEFSAWIAINNAMTARDWNRATQVFGQLDSDWRGKARQIKPLLTSP